MVSYSTLTSDDIHNLLDEEVLSLSHPWDGTVPFPVFVVEDMTSFSPNIFHSPPEEVDICPYLTASKYPTKRLYFYPSEYPPPLIDEYMSSQEGGFSPGWISLKRDFDIAAIEARNGIISNGGGRSPPFSL